MPSEAPTAGLQPLPFSDAAECKTWLAQLPHANPVQSHALLAAHAHALLAAAMAPTQKLAVLELLREPVAAT